MTSHLPGAQPYSVIYQSAKLGDVPYLLKDFEMARQLDAERVPIGRLYGNSSGALAALAHGLVVTARARPDRFSPQAQNALTDFESFFRTAKSRDIRRINWRGIQYGIYNLDPLKRWLTERLKAYTGLLDVSGFTFTDLCVPVYVCVQDKDGFPVFFGPPDISLRAVYHSCSTRIENAPVLDACLAGLCTMLSTDAYPVNSPKGASGGHYYKDSRPAFPDISAYVLDMEASDPRPIVKNAPYTPLRPWRGNALTQPFIMHSWRERRGRLSVSPTRRGTRIRSGGFRSQSGGERVSAWRDSRGRQSARPQRRGRRHCRFGCDCLRLRAAHVLARCLLRPGHTKHH